MSIWDKLNNLGINQFHNAIVGNAKISADKNNNPITIRNASNAFIML
jgi:hypothetical protein